jgi:hypothetical protein
MSHLAKAVSGLGGDESAKRNGALHYESLISIDSRAAPGVRYTIHRMSFGRRMELSRRVRELTGKIDFLKAGTETHEKIEANILAQEIDAMYLRWGLVSIDGLIIDGESATKEQMLEKGPEDLTREVVIAIKAQCGLSEAETKN